MMKGVHLSKGKTLAEMDMARQTEAARLSTTVAVDLTMNQAEQAAKCMHEQKYRLYDTASALYFLQDALRSGPSNSAFEGGIAAILSLIYSALVTHQEAEEPHLNTLEEALRKAIASKSPQKGANPC